MKKRQTKRRSRSKPVRKTRGVGSAAPRHRVKRTTKPTSTALQRLVEEISLDMHRMLARKRVRDLLWEMVTREESQSEARGGISRRQLDALAAKDLSSAWSCFWYDFYLKVIKPIYGFTQIEPVQDQRGDVTKLDNNGGFSEDGDFTFQISNLSPPQSYQGTPYETLHCEITPCNRDPLQSFIDQLKATPLPMPREPRWHAEF